MPGTLRCIHITEQQGRGYKDRWVILLIKATVLSYHSTENRLAHTNTFFSLHTFSSSLSLTLFSLTDMLTCADTKTSHSFLFILSVRLCSPQGFSSAKSIPGSHMSLPDQQYSNSTEDSDNLLPFRQIATSKTSF